MQALNIVAVIISPVVAVLVTLWYQHRKERRVNRPGIAGLQALDPDNPTGDSALANPGRNRSCIEPHRHRLP